MGNATHGTDSEYPIHLGIWTNWSRGPIMGRTLTLEQEDANLLIAFTGFFIAFVGTRAWKIICFIFHRAYSTLEPQNAGYHQLQATLRNSSSPEDGFRLLALLLWRWRKSRRWFRPVPILVVAAVSITGFTVAGGFSSRISTTMGNEVLIKSADCGYPMGTLGSDVEADYAYRANQARNIDAASNYAEACYSGDSAGLTDCNRFVVKQLTDNSTVDTEAKCPFSDNICRNASTNLLLDTGYLDSHIHLGLNAPPEQRILWRNVLHCAPLVTEGFTSQVNTPQGNVTRYHYGRTYNNSVPIDYVFEAADVESQYEKYLQATKSGYFELEMLNILVQNGKLRAMSSAIVPIPSLLRSDADTYLAFLSGNGVRFTEFINDDWYRINPISRNTTFTGADNGTSQMSQEPIYLPKEPASPLGCTNQYQFCKPGIPNNTCTPLSSLYDAVDRALPLFNVTREEFVEDLGDSDTATPVVYFMNTVWMAPMTIYYLVQHLGPRALDSQKTLTDGLQGPMSDNQWQKDVTSWWNYSLAATQAAFINTAVGPTDLESINYRHSFNGTYFDKVCNSQKIQSTAFASFSVLGLFFTFAAGLAIVLTSYLLEPISKLLFGTFPHQFWMSNSNTPATYMGYQPHKHLEWTLNATYQLQRLAHEELGLGTWSHGTHTIPETKPDELLGCLDMSNPEHPILRRPLFADNTRSRPYDSSDSTKTAYEEVRGKDVLPDQRRVFDEDREKA
ncbi:hypothetical protein F5Y19DRAFT_477924 [Xylariaceae sp. FL1651]|nr:hypothetical protein F5Y19DRAFT_477924 [Xylariaceae sp. FL1651]